MKRYYLIIYLICYIQVFPQNWVWQNPQPQGNPLHNLFVIDSTHAWATGDFGALVYTDNGEYWHLYKELNTLEHIGGIYFITNNIGWLVTRSSDKVYKTTNGGSTWEIIASLA
jgi:photosystem II stability/assembly factor-like uncharacterized protein